MPQPYCNIIVSLIYFVFLHFPTFGRFIHCPSIFHDFSNVIGIRFDKLIWSIIDTDQHLYFIVYGCNEFLLYLFIYLSIYLSIYLPFYLYICLAFYMSIHPSIQRLNDVWKIYEQEEKKEQEI